MDDISGRTVICGLIGDPVDHSMSPAMHNAAFHELGLNYIYVPFRVKSEELGPAVAGMRAMNIKGLNVTIPHKVAVMPLLDELDDMAAKIGAVNTIVNYNGALSGYNTDASGFVQPLLERGIELKGKKVLIIGAGGAARGICFALVQGGAKLIILNRTSDRARELADQLLRQSAGPEKVGELNAPNLREAATEAEIIVNTTSVGMGKARMETPMPAELLRPGTLVYDIVYYPSQTKLLSDAVRAGCDVVSGTEMLAWQGALAFEKWTGQRAPVQIMKDEMERQLKHEN